MRFAPNTRRCAATLLLALLVLLGLISLAPAQQPPPDATATAAPVGRLVQPKGRAGCIHRKGINRCAQGRAVTSPEDIAISPDGRHAYVASYGSHGIAIFRRARRTGHLDQLPGRRGCVRHEGGEFCRAGRAMGGRGAREEVPARIKSRNNSSVQALRWRCLR